MLSNKFIVTLCNIWIRLIDYKQITDMYPYLLKGDIEIVKSSAIALPSCSTFILLYTPRHQTACVNKMCICPIFWHKNAPEEEKRTKDKKKIKEQTNSEEEEKNQEENGGEGGGEEEKEKRKNNKVLTGGGEEVERNGENT
jgi:hypothetical protein